MPVIVSRNATRTALVGVMLGLGGCAGDHGPTAVQTEALVTHQARAAITRAAAAVSGTAPKADARWLGCVQNMAWKYEGGGTFQAPEGDVAAQLAAIRAALTKAGYTDVTQVEGKVAVERDGVTFVIHKRLKTAGFAPHWAFSFRSRCQPLSLDDRARIDHPARAADRIAP